MLEAFASGDRDAAIASIRDAVGAAGWLLDARPFSGLVMCFQLELRAESAAAFLANLRAAEVRLSAASEQELRAGAAAASGGDVPIVLAVRFRAGDPDLRHEVPSVPGCRRSACSAAQHLHASGSGEGGTSAARSRS
jgi:hypothetical protein